jgi:hypothetical protein
MVKLMDTLEYKEVKSSWNYKGSDTDGIESIAEASIPVPIDVKKGDENY